jgi:hypothetical protein
MPGARTALKGFLLNSFLHEPGSGMRDLDSLSGTEPSLVKEILDRLSDQALADLIGRAKTRDAADVLRHLSAISTDRSRSVLQRMGPSWLVVKVRSEHSLHSLDELLSTMGELDPASVPVAISQFSAEDIKFALVSDEYWPEKILSRLAKSNPRLVLDTFDNAVLEKFYQGDRPSSFIGYSDAAKLLTELRRSNVEVWSAVMERLSVARIAESINAVAKTKGDLMVGYYLSEFLEELARFDVHALVELGKLAPQGIDSHVIDDLKKDFPAPG